jgi:hypothetical protein
MQSVQQREATALAQKGSGWRGGIAEQLIQTCKRCVLGQSARTVGGDCPETRRSQTLFQTSPARGVQRNALENDAARSVAEALEELLSVIEGGGPRG